MAKIWWNEKVEDFNTVKLHITDIVTDPLNKLRIKLSNQFISGKFSQQQLDDLLYQLKDLFPNPELYQAHYENYQSVMKTGDLKTPLNLAEENSQFFWGAVLAHIAANPQIQKNWDQSKGFKKISSSTIWRRIASSSHMKKELKNHAFMIKTNLNNPNTRIVWSEPVEGSYPNIGYCFVHDKNLIIDDMLWSLIAGVPNAAVAINHEIAHSKGTQGAATPKMELLSQEISHLQTQALDFQKSGNKAELLRTSVELTKKIEEYKMRFYFFDELENMFANRYAINQGGDDDKARLNALETCICGTGYNYLKGAETIEEFAQDLNPSEKIAHLKHAARYSFFCNNGLINDNLTDWHKIGVYPEFINYLDKLGNFVSPENSFLKLREICNKLEEMQPKKMLRMLNENAYNRRMTEMSKARKLEIDDFFDSFVLPLFNEMTKGIEKQFHDQHNQMQTAAKDFCQLTPEQMQQLQKSLENITQQIKNEENLQDLSNIQMPQSQEKEQTTPQTGDENQNESKDADNQKEDLNNQQANKPDTDQQQNSEAAQQNQMDNVQNQSEENSNGAPGQQPQASNQIVTQSADGEENKPNENTEISPANHKQQEKIADTEPNTEENNQEASKANSDSSQNNENKQTKEELKENSISGQSNTDAQNIDDSQEEASQSANIAKSEQINPEAENDLSQFTPENSDPSQDNEDSTSAKSVNAKEPTLANKNPSEINNEDNSNPASSNPEDLPSETSEAPDTEDNLTENSTSDKIEAKETESPYSDQKLTDTLGDEANNANDENEQDLEKPAKLDGRQNKTMANDAKSGSSSHPQDLNKLNNQETDDNQKSKSCHITGPQVSQPQTNENINGLEEQNLSSINDKTAKPNSKNNDIIDDGNKKSDNKGFSPDYNGKSNPDNQKKGKSDNLNNENLEGYEIPKLPKTKPENSLDEELLNELMQKSEDINDLTQEQDNDDLSLDEATNSDKYEQVTPGSYRESTPQDALPEQWNSSDNLTKSSQPRLISMEEMRSNAKVSRQANFRREGNLNAYERLVERWRPIIGNVTILLNKIIQQQKMEIAKKGQSTETKKKMEIFPYQGPHRLSMEKQKQLAMKLQNNDPTFSLKDLERFKNDYKIKKDIPVTDTEVPSVDVGLLIDGSGSMDGNPFEYALAIGCILFEASKKIPQINTYIYMMGQPNPLRIAIPGDDNITIAKRLESIRSSQGGSQDHLTPAMVQFLKDSARHNQQKPKQKSGFSHIFSITDGGNSDYGRYDVNKIIETILTKNEFITFDSFFIESWNQNYTKPLIKRLRNQGNHRIDMVENIDDSSIIPEKISEMLTKRMKDSKLKNAPTNDFKNKLINDALKSIRG